MKPIPAPAAGTQARAEATTRVPLGVVVATVGVCQQVDHPHIVRALARHAAGDWGEVDPDDRQQNEIALREGFRLLSVYRDPSGRVFWIITEADRSATTVLLPDEY
jgi:hypothetical protein